MGQGTGRTVFGPVFKNRIVSAAIMVAVKWAKAKKTVEITNVSYDPTRELYEAYNKEFAKDWVTIDVGQMSFDEIKLLVTIACYYETKRQEESKL